MVYLEYLGWNNSGGHPWQNNGAEYIGGSPGRRNSSAEVRVHYLLILLNNTTNRNQIYRI